MNAPFPIPKGLRHSAQGCPVGGTTLGNVVHYFPNPSGVAAIVGVLMATTPLGLMNISTVPPG